MEKRFKNQETCPNVKNHCAKTGSLLQTSTLGYALFGCEFIFCPTGGAVNPQTNLQHITEELPCCSTRWSRSEGLDTPTKLSVCEFVMESQWKEPEISGFSAWNRGSNHPRQSRTAGIRLSVSCSTPLPPLDSVYTPSSRPELEYSESPHWPEPHYRQKKR